MIAKVLANINQSNNYADLYSCLTSTPSPYVISYQTVH
ncbi:DEHA2D12914p [Debaryomyces hansenii CBS767]|uniref:DEHA2D12914p n=1 Tax=Debaryomyces hansenii (strain ATCC 36239 / CBS 767 / BCRC 21394 / JCM 1990 / NBRC 0083 / IGC 2968) TaxID=284592 RepID=B5RTH8_DEBHA|nr:DEHA2D12914p [Debaryomyces hansenii CBS767]CAR65663.1 DEHA2D12914p [Debaryomyces hansenii CBS767]|eukprot:XP_002770309.1 DEHA2D12914p [Debaryomyces hansenii CBS767]